MSIGIIAIVLSIVAILIVAFILFIVRPRAARPDDLPLPDIAEISQPIDYTSLPEEAPRSLGERFRAAPPAIKALILLAPVALIGVIVVLLLTFGGSGGSNVIANPRAATATAPGGRARRGSWRRKNRGGRPD
jgi:hypothetical protein